MSLLWFDGCSDKNVSNSFWLFLILFILQVINLVFHKGFGDVHIFCVIVWWLWHISWCIIRSVHKSEVSKSQFPLLIAPFLFVTILCKQLKMWVYLDWASGSFSQKRNWFCSFITFLFILFFCKLIESIWRICLLVYNCDFFFSVWLLLKTAFCGLLEQPVCP